MQPGPRQLLATQLDTDWSIYAHAHMDVFSWGSCNNLAYAIEGAEEASLTFTDDCESGDKRWHRTLVPRTSLGDLQLTE